MVDMACFPLACDGRQESSKKYATAAGYERDQRSGRRTLKLARFEMPSFATPLASEVRMDDERQPIEAAICINPRDMFFGDQAKGPYVAAASSG